jgi:hypothetical protein
LFDKHFLGKKKVGQEGEIKFLLEKEDEKR